MTYINYNLTKIGFWAASSSALFGCAYTIPHVLSEMKLLHHPQDLVAMLISSLFLAPAFLITMISLHYAAKKPVRIYTAIGAAFAVLYCSDVTLVYLTQVPVVLPGSRETYLAGNVLLYDRGTFLMAVDYLGYFFMSLSTFFAAFAFKESKWLYRSLLWNGALMPLLVVAFVYPVIYFVGALWMITFPIAMIAAAMFFKYAVFTINIKP